MAGFHEDRAGIAELLETVLRQHLADAGIPPVNDTFEQVMGEYAIGRHPSTREMRFFLEDLAAFTPELANRLRERVLSAYRSWTVVPQYGEMAFTVSAGGVLFGERKVKGPISEETKDYQDWLRAAQECDEGRKGEDRRQYRHVVPLIPAAIPAARKRGHAVLAAFRIAEPSRQVADTVAWVLAQGGEEKPSLAPGGASKEHSVTAEGAAEPAFCQKYWPATDIPSPFFLLAHVFRWRDRSKLAITHPAAKRRTRPVEIGSRIDSRTRDAAS